MWNMLNFLNKLWALKDFQNCYNSFALDHQHSKKCWVKYNQSLFKTSHVIRRPSLKRLSGMQVQLLSLWMGKHQILQNCLLCLRLNFIFEIIKEIK